MAPEVAAALIAAAASLVLGIYNLRRLAGLEKLKADLADEAMVHKALIDYQYDARRRLYASYQPAMFQLLDLSQNAIRVIKGLTDPEIWPQLAKPEPNPPTQIRPTLPAPTYEALDAIYGLYAPLVVIRIMGRGLTQFDLSLEPYIELQYYVATKIYGSFKDDVVLAAIKPRLEYDPFAEGWRELREKDPKKYWWQGLTMGRLEGMLDVMTASAGKRSPERVVTFGEFEKRYNDMFDDPDEFRRKSVATAANALHRFQPPDRPIFWRMLIAQARLYEALLRTNTADDLPSSDGDWRDLLRLDDPDDFRWRAKSVRGSELDETLDVTTAYLAEKLIMPWRHQHHSTQRTEGSTRQPDQRRPLQSRS